MTRFTMMMPSILLALLATLAGCGQPDAAASNTEAFISRPRPIPPRPFRRWECTATGKDGDVFGDYTGVGLTQQEAQANALAACKANPDYASCWIDSCRQVL